MIGLPNKSLRLCNLFKASCCTYAALHPHLQAISCQAKEDVAWAVGRTSPVRVLII
jgi:hypothetical protein